jgi:hypothetical protein
MPDVDPSSAQLWKVFPPICQLFLCKNDFATALTLGAEELRDILECTML